ncbi:MAG: Rrf2 family transcriptional regulator [Pseudomonadota bacterium]
MKLSTKGRYAVMAMVDLACHSSGHPIALADIAERQEISLSYLEQLFAKLRRGGLVKSVRGPGGGYLLAYAPRDMRISDIVLAVDEPLRVTRCRPGSPLGCKANKSRCLTHDLWEELGNQIQLFLSLVTIADVVERRVLDLGTRLRQTSGYGALPVDDGAALVGGDRLDQNPAAAAISAAE